MSRTDVHRPWNVQMSDPYNRHRLHQYNSNWPETGDVSLMPLYGCCGCSMCTGRDTRRLTRRRQRHTTKKFLRRQDWDAVTNKVPWAWQVAGTRLPWSSTYPEQARAVKAARDEREAS